MPEHRLLECRELIREVDPEFLVEPAPRLANRRKRLGLSATAIQGDGEDAPSAFAERRVLDEPLRPAHDADVVPEVELCLEPSLLGGGTEIDEPLGLGDGGRPVGQVGEGPSPPELERLGEDGLRAIRLTIPCVRDAGFDQSFETGGVDRVGGDVEPIPFRQRLDRGDSVHGVAAVRSRSAPASPTSAEVPHPRSHRRCRRARADHRPEARARRGLLALAG